MSVPEPREATATSDTTEPVPPPISNTSTSSGAGTPRFDATVKAIPDDVRARMDGVSMRPGCPVGYDDLRYLRVSYWGFDGVVHLGELVVHREVADGIVSVFRSLFDARFPIRQMRLVDDFGAADDPDDGADDWASIEADNTSAFNCRRRTGSGTEYSEHSWGWAIDINPLENPYVTAAGSTSHAASRPYLDRSAHAPGVIAADGPVIAAFESIGWAWGGRWSEIRDFQHFSRGGR